MDQDNGKNKSNFRQWIGATKNTRRVGVGACCHVAAYLLPVGVQKRCTTRRLLHAVWKGDLEEVQLLIEAGADTEHAKRRNGWTPLYIAVYKGHTEIVKMLLEAGADANKEAGADKAGNSSSFPLFMAASRGNLEVVKALLEAGADKDKATKSGQTSLFIATLRGKVDVARVLLEA